MLKIAKNELNLTKTSESYLIYPLANDIIFQIIVFGIIWVVFGRPRSQYNMVAFLLPVSGKSIIRITGGGSWRARDEMRVGQNVTHRPDGRWEARYIKGRSSDGKAVYGFCYGKTQEEAIQKCEDAKRLLENATIASPKLFWDVYALWVNAENTEDSARLADKYILPAIGDSPVTQLTDKSLSQLMQSIKTKASATETKKCFELLSGALNFAVREDFLIATPMGLKTLQYQSGRKTKLSKESPPISEREYLSTEQAKAMEAALLDGLNGKRPGVCIGLYLCLHLGLSRMEVGALQWGDIDFHKRTIRINKVTSKQLKTVSSPQAFEMTPIEERILPLPRFVVTFLENISDRYKSPESFIVYNKNGTQCQAIEYARTLTELTEACSLSFKLDMKILRDTFIVRCIKNGLDVFTIAKILGVSESTELQSRFGDFFQTRVDNLCRLDSYTNGTSAENGEPQKLKLLILGAGGYGHTVKEIAEKIGMFDQIAFLDDNTAIPEAIDILENAPRYRSQFPFAYPAIGDCKRRAELIVFLEKAGYCVPRIIHPSVTLSPSSVIESGVIIEANATVGAMAHIKKGCIISSNALIDRGAVVSEAVHVDSSATVTKDCFVPPQTKIESGTVYIGEKE